MSTVSAVTERRPLGRTSLSVTRLCFGSGGLGSLPLIFGYDTPEGQAVDTVAAELDSPINFLDTSSGYSDGEAERRIGLGIARRGGLPPGFVLATKVDPDPVTGAFDGDAVRRSVEGSLTRLGIDRIQLLYLHDPERISFAQATAPGGPVEALFALRDQGVAAHLGVAGGPVGNLLQFLDLGGFEVVLTHNRYTLLDRTAEPLLERAKRDGLGFVQGAPFGGGVLAKGLAAFDTYAYRPMTTQTRRRAEQLAEICAAANVPLGAAALRFTLSDNRVDSTVVGVTHPERIQQILTWADWDIPGDVWARLLEASGRDAGLDNDPR
jgi:D-threo-aldose 1-dehydrogenase